MTPEETVQTPPRIETAEDALPYLHHVGGQEDAAIDLGEAALALALVFLPGVHPDRYRQHLRKMGAEVKKAFAEQGKEDTVQNRIAALRHVLHDTHGYRGDDKSYDDIQNISLVRVIERRQGMPIALGLLYIILARQMNWPIDGLNFPGHFLVRMEKAGTRVILDPFRGGAELGAAALRQLLKAVAGPGAELSHNFYAAASNREILIRLENNLKTRLIAIEEYAQAVRTIEAMEAFAPQEYRLAFDKGVLCARLGRKAEAVQALESYIARTPDVREKQQAHTLLGQIIHET